MILCIAYCKFGHFTFSFLPSVELYVGSIDDVLGECWRLEQSYERLFAAVIWIASIGTDSNVNNVNGARSVESHLKTEL